MILKTSGTTGKPKEIVYTDEDLLKVEQSVKRIYEIWGITGTVYNLFTAGANLSFIAANDYAFVSGGKVISAVDTNVSNVFGSCPVNTKDDVMNQLVERSRIDKPNVVIGLPCVVLDFLKQADISEVKLVICNKGITGESVEEIKTLTGPKVEVASVYGFTEAKAAWTSCRGDEGYHIFEESGYFTKDSGEELIYNGHHTGDSGKILEGKCPACDLGLQRLYNIKRT